MKENKQKNQKIRIKQELWESMYINPNMRHIIEEAGLELAQGDDDPSLDGQPPEELPPEQAPNQEIPEGEGGLNLEQLAADFQEGKLQQEDLMKLYQNGQLSKEQISMIMGQGEEAEPQSEEELLSQQITQTNDVFVKFALYDKVNDLTEKLDYFKDNFDDIQSDTYERVLQLGEFLNILSSLIFNLDTQVSYQMYGSILLQLTEIFNQYNKEQKQEELRDEATGEESDYDVRDLNAADSPIDNAQ